MNATTAALISDLIVFRSRAGSPALSDGDTLTDPRGRRVPAAGVWTETEEDPEDVWESLTDEQRAVVCGNADLQDARDAETAALRARLEALDTGAGGRVTESGRAFSGQGGRLSAVYRKQGGRARWLAPCTVDEAMGLIAGDLKLVYRINGYAAEIVPASRPLAPSFSIFHNTAQRQAR